MQISPVNAKLIEDNTNSLTPLEIGPGKTMAADGTAHETAAFGVW